MSDTNDVTQILNALDVGDGHASDRLLPLVYDELRKLASQKLARESTGQTLQPTALVHEVYLRLVDVQHQQRWDSRGHFFSAAAEAMRRILVEKARRKARVKHGGQIDRVEFQDNDAVDESSNENLLALDDALDRLAAEDAQKAELVKLRYFAGLTLEQAAEALGISRATASRYWTYSRAWLYNAMDE